MIRIIIDTETDNTSLLKRSIQTLHPNQIVSTMAKTKNSVQLVGYLAADPVLRKAVNGRPYTKVRMATDFYRRQPDGSILRKVTWHTIMAWAHIAESFPATFIKGSHVIIEGSISNNTFLGNDGSKKFFSHIVVSRVVDLDR
ncbi:MAG: single-stranded DNA-binding protein [Sediminibacterium sp.]